MRWFNVIISKRILFQQAHDGGLKHRRIAYDADVIYYTPMFQPSGHWAFGQHQINVEATSWRSIDVDATLYKKHMPAGNF